MRPSSLIALHIGAFLSTGTQATYLLTNHYNDTNFFSSFDFFSEKDPTNGFVKYLAAPDASLASLAGYVNKTNTLSTRSEGPPERAIYLATDNTLFNPTAGRNSVRVHSKQNFTHGLFIADIKHMPGGVCSVWPAFWTVGPNWPNDGEIDIFEGVNDNVMNTVTLHTSAGCTMKPMDNVVETSKLHGGNCNENNGLTGCGFATDKNESNYGAGFNLADGGVYAMEWTSKFIRVFFFPRSAIPEDISNPALVPNPDGWGKAMAGFVGGECDIDAHFKDHKIVFNTAICGDWAGAADVWKSEGSECMKLVDKCVDYAKGSPTELTNAYWEINSVKVYQQTSATRKRGRSWSILNA